MAPPNNDDQFKFLISCIRYSNNGRVDFGEVANECGIVSKGAAAKRYERMMKAHGIAPNPSPGKISGQSSTNNGGSSKGSPAKKRKVADAIGSVDGDDEGKLGSGVQDEFSGGNTVDKKNNSERGDSGEGLEELAFATVEYGNGVSSSAGNQSGGEVHPQTGTLHIEDDGDAHESIVTD